MARRKSQAPRERLIYAGPPSGVTLGDGREVLLRRGRPADLPEDHPYTQALLAAGLLQRVTGEKDEPTTEATDAS